MDGNIRKLDRSGIVDNDGIIRWHLPFGNVVKHIAKSDVFESIALPEVLAPNNDQAFEDQMQTFISVSHKLRADIEFSDAHDALPVGGEAARAAGGRFTWSNGHPAFFLLGLLRPCFFLHNSAGVVAGQPRLARVPIGFAEAVQA